MDMFGPPPAAPEFPTGAVEMPGPEEIEEVLNAMLDAFESDAEERTKVRYPSWFDEEAAAKQKPKPDEVKAEAKRIWDDFSSLRARFRDTVDFISPTRPGYVFSDADQYEAENRYHDSTPEAEIELATANLAGIDPALMPTARTNDEFVTTADKADYLYACFDDAERIHAATGHGDFKTEAVRTALVYGRLAALVIYSTDVEYDEMPVITRLIDPASCAPVYDQHGMVKMVRSYSTTVADAISAFNADDKVAGRIRNPKDGQAKEDHHACDVLEYWDRWWRLVWVDGHLVHGPLEHRLGYPPFAYQVGALGMPSYLYDLHGASVFYANQRNAWMVGEGRGWSSSRNPVANPNRGLSHIDIMKYPIKLREAIQARTITAFRREVDPPMVIEQDIIAADKGVPEIDRGPNARNPIEMGHENINILPVAPNAASLGPMLTQVNEALGRVTFSAAAYGINTNSNVSGFAVENLAEQGRDKLLPHLVTLEAFYRQIAEMQLRMFRDWGWVTRQGDGDRGVISVPRHRVVGDMTPIFDLTPDALHRTGTQVKVKMTSVRLSNLGNVANALAILNNMGLLRKRWAFEILGDPNPDRAVLELEQEQAAAMPPPGAEGPVGIQGASLPGMGMPPGPGSGPRGPLGEPDPFEGVS